MISHSESSFWVFSLYTYTHVHLHTHIHTYSIICVCVHYKLPSSGRWVTMDFHCHDYKFSMHKQIATTTKSLSLLSTPLIFLHIEVRLKTKRERSFVNMPIENHLALLPKGKCLRFVNGAWVTRHIHHRDILPDPILFNQRNQTVAKMPHWNMVKCPHV